MKNLFALLLCLLFALQSFTQPPTLRARYLVQRTHTLEDDSDPPSITLDYEAVFLKKGNAYLTYYKPLFLKKYPSGLIEYTSATLGKVSWQLAVDSFDRIDYVHLDSMFMRSHSASASQGMSGWNSFFTFEKGCRLWKIQDDEKIIKGLVCKKAVLVSSTSKTEVWFTSDFPVEVGPYGQVDLPGLAVTATISSMNETWTLIEVETGIELDDKLFWPDQFYQTFINRGHLKSKKNPQQLLPD